MTPAEAREQQKHFKLLTRQVIAFLAQLEVLMMKKSDEYRGAEIARLSNQLELANDSALRFGLGLERNGVKLRKVKR